MESTSTFAEPATPAVRPPDSNNDDPSLADDSAKRKRQPRNSACQPCASLKMKCVPGAVVGKCERCQRMNRDCVAAVPKARKKRTESNVGFDSPTNTPAFRIPDSTASTNATTTATTTPGLNVQRPRATDADQPRESLLSRPDIRHNGSRSFTTLLTRGLRLDSPYILPGDLLHAIDHNTVHSSLTVFQQLSTLFPFAHVNTSKDVVLLVAERPFTALAICAVTTGANPGLQARVCYAFRLALSSKAIVEGERTIDLLVGLLIFLAWHHHYLEKQQIHQYLCLLVGMANDIVASPGHPPPEVAIERDRALLGCYYLCSCISRKAFNQPNPMKWTDNLRQRAVDVVHASSLPSDHDLIARVELAHTIDDLNKDISTADHRQSTHTAILDAYAVSIANRLKSLKHHFPALGRIITLSAAMIDTHQQRLIANPDNTAVLVRCACDISDYIDDLLGRPAAYMYQMTTIDWTSLLSILLFMAKVAKHLPNTGGWEAGAAASVLSPVSILDRLCAHMASAPHNNRLAPRNENLPRWFRMFCEGVKAKVVPDHDKLGHADTNFDSVNSKSSSAANMSLPYNNSNSPNSFANPGVLDEAFLRGLMAPS